MSDRQLGYLVIAILVLFLLSPISYLTWKSFAPVETRTAQFNSINSLSFLNIQDPVRIKGVDVGLVRDVYNSDQKTLVKFETYKPINIHRDYKVTVSVKGLMGDRYLAIDPGSTQKELVSKKEILHGGFQPGPTEAVAYAGNLRSEISRLSAVIKEFKDGTDLNASFISRFNGVMNDFDTLSGTILILSKELNQDLNKSIDSLNYFIEQTSSMSNKLSESVPEIVSSLENLLIKTDILVTRVNDLINKSETMVSYLEGPQLENLGDFIKRVRINLKSLRETIHDIKKDGLKLHVRPW